MTVSTANTTANTELAGPVVRSNLQVPAAVASRPALLYSTNSPLPTKFGRKNSSTPFAMIDDGVTTPIGIDKIVDLFSAMTQAEALYAVGADKEANKSIQWLLQESSKANAAKEIVARFGYGLATVFSGATGRIAVPLAKLFQLWAAVEHASALAARNALNNPSEIPLARVSSIVPTLTEVLPFVTNLPTRKVLREMAKLEGNTAFAILFHVGLNFVPKVDGRHVALKTPDRNADGQRELTGEVRYARPTEVQAYSADFVAGANVDGVARHGVCIGVLEEGSQDVIWVAFVSASTMVATISGLELELPRIAPRTNRLPIKALGLSAADYALPEDEVAIPVRA